MSYAAVVIGALRVKLYENSMDPDQTAAPQLTIRVITVYCKGFLSYTCTQMILSDLILYIPVNNFTVMSRRVFWVEPVLSKD